MTTALVSCQPTLFSRLFQQSTLGSSRTVRGGLCWWPLLVRVMLWKTDCDWPFNQPLYKVMGISPLSPSLFIPNHDPDQQSIAQACLFKQLRPLTANLKFDIKLSWFCYMTLLHCCGAFIKDLLQSSLLLMQHVLHCWSRSWRVQKYIYHVMMYT